MGDHDDQRSFWARNGYLISTAYSLAGAYILFGVFGDWLDRKYQTGSRYTLCGLALAFVYTLYEIWKLARHDPDAVRNDPPSPAPHDHDRDDSDTPK